MTSVQAFFAIILGLALLAYVIVVIMGTLNNSSIIPISSQSNSVLNESGSITSTGYQLATFSTPGFSSPTITAIVNGTSGAAISSGNWTFNSATATLTNATAVNFPTVKISYTYNSNAGTTNNANDILSNTSAGVTSFFGAINPVYAILAILVIILVLVVLVRVVTGGAGTGRSEYSPQL